MIRDNFFRSEKEERVFVAKKILYENCKKIYHHRLRIGNPFLF